MSWRVDLRIAKGADLARIFYRCARLSRCQKVEQQSRRVCADGAGRRGALSLIACSSKRFVATDTKRTIAFQSVHLHVYVWKIIPYADQMVITQALHQLQD